MRLLGFEQALPANSSLQATLDFSKAAKYLLWAYTFGASWVEFQKHDNIISAAPCMDPEGTLPVSPCFVFEKTDDPVTVTLHNLSSSPVTASVVFAVSDEAYGDIIDRDFHLRSSTLGRYDPDTLEGGILIRNDRRNADFIILRLAFFAESPKWLKTSRGEDILSPGAPFPYGPFLLYTNARLSPSEYVCGDIFIFPDAPLETREAVYWELPCGEDVPEGITLPALRPNLQLMPVFSWKPVVWPPTPPRVEWPLWSAGPPVELVDFSFIGYPIAPPQRRLLTPSIQETAFWDLAGDIKGTPYGKVTPPWKDIPGVTGIIGIGPSGVHLMRCDDIGRVRHTDKAITYKSGKVEKTDTSTTTITPERPASRVCFKAVALGWEVKVLTLYDLLRGKTISDVDTIYLDAGDSFSEPLEAVEIQVSCPSASGSSTGKLYYYVGI